MNRQPQPCESRTQRVDMHVHTVYSHDGYLTLEALDAACRRRNITTVAIADHNEIDGALRAEAMRVEGSIRTRIIVAEEISTAEGEIIGLFLRERISPGMSMAGTIESIRSQGGLVYLNHPFGYSTRAGRLEIEALDGLWDQIDVVEVFNGRNMNQRANAMAASLARIRNKPGGVGSDAHSAWEVGRGCVCMPDFDGPGEFLAALRHATYACRPCPVAYRVVFKARKMLWPRPRPGRLAS